MKIYNYSSITGEFLGESEADESPLEPGVFLIPNYATTNQPPITKLNEIACFVSGIWVIRSDYRGQNYWMPADYDNVSGTEIIGIGELPENALLSKPAVPQDIQTARELERIAAKSLKIWKNGFEFLAEFTDEELNILATHPSLAGLALKLTTWPGEIWNTDERIIGGLSLMVYHEAITEEEKTRILTK